MPKYFRAFFAVLFFACSSPVLATTYFSDTFTGNDLSQWSIGQGDTSWDAVDGQLIGEIGRHGSTMILAKGTGGLSDYEVTASVVNISGVDQHFLLRASENYTRYYLLELRYGDQFWPQDGNSLRLWRYDGSYALVTPDVPRIMLQNRVYKLHIVMVGPNIKVYIDDELVMNATDNAGYFPSGSFGLHNYGGDYFYRSVKNIFDDIVVSSVDQGPVVHDKIIILPGMGASWNGRAMVYNEDVADDAWRMTPFVDNYDALIAALEANGLVRGSDFYMWNYDWRRSVSDIVTKLDNFIDSKIEAGEKVNLVGHSLGGLVARVWAQDNKSDSRLGGVVSLGSPHWGAVKAYDVWAGAKIIDRPDVGSVVLNVLLELQRKNFQSKVATVRNMAPVIQDLIPTFNFAKAGGLPIIFSNMSFVNNYMLSKNSFVSNIFGTFKAVGGKGYDVARWETLGPRSIFDQVLGLWPDGKPTSYQYEDGDGSVLMASSRFEGDDFGQLDSDHGAIVDKSIEDIFNEFHLGIAQNVDVDHPIDNGLLFYLGSPATMSVSCDGGEPVSELDGFVLIDNASYEKCLINILGTGSGTYHLVAGKTDDENSWRYFEDEVVAGEVQELTFDTTDSDIFTDNDNLLWFYDLIKRDIEHLLKSYQNNINLTNAILMVGKHDNLGLLREIEFFRRRQKESIISERIIGNLKSVLSINNTGVSKTSAEYSLTRISRLKSLVDSNTKTYIRRGRTPTIFGSQSYLLLDKLVSAALLEMSLGEYDRVVADDILVSNIYLDIWGY